LRAGDFASRRRHPGRPHLRADQGRPRRFHQSVAVLRLSAGSRALRSRQGGRRHRAHARPADRAHRGVLAPGGAEPGRRGRGMSARRPALRPSRALIIALALVWMTPFLWMLVAAFRPERFGGAGMASLVPDYAPTLANFAEAWESADFALYYFNTF